MAASKVGYLSVIVCNDGTCFLEPSGLYVGPDPFSAQSEASALRPRGHGGPYRVGNLLLTAGPV
jgi:hypothetical protein